MVDAFHQIFKQSTKSSGIFKANNELISYVYGSYTNVENLVKRADRLSHSEQFIVINKVIGNNFQILSVEDQAAFVDEMKKEYKHMDMLYEILFSAIDTQLDKVIHFLKSNTANLSFIRKEVDFATHQIRKELETAFIQIDNERLCNNYRIELRRLESETEGNGNSKINWREVNNQIDKFMSLYSFTAIDVQRAARHRMNFVGKRIGDYCETSLAEGENSHLIGAVSNFQQQKCLELPKLCWRTVNKANANYLKTVVSFYEHLISCIEIQRPFVLNFAQLKEEIKENGDRAKAEINEAVDEFEKETFQSLDKLLSDLSDFKHNKKNGKKSDVPERKTKSIKNNGKTLLKKSDVVLNALSNGAPKTASEQVSNSRAGSKESIKSDLAKDKELSSSGSTDNSVKDEAEKLPSSSSNATSKDSEVSEEMIESQISAKDDEIKFSLITKFKSNLRKFRPNKLIGEATKDAEDQKEDKKEIKKDIKNEEEEEMKETKKEIKKNDKKQEKEEVKNEDNDDESVDSKKEEQEDLPSIPEENDVEEKEEKKKVEEEKLKEEDQERKEEKKEEVPLAAKNLKELKQESKYKKKKNGRKYGKARVIEAINGEEE